MIQPNELRVGNLLLKDDGLPERVATIYSNETVKFLGFDHPTALKACKPIPLTEEWLLKAGFDKSTDRYGGFISPPFGKNKTRLRWTYQEHIEVFRKIYWAHFIGDGGRNGSGRYIRTDCVHQLQNLYHALTGEELPIKL